MVAYRGRRDFRSGSAIVIVIVVVTLVFAAGAVMTYRQGGWTWVSIGLACGTAFSLAGILEALIFRVQLTDDALVVTDLRGRRRYLKSDITRVEEAKGVPTYIILASGRGVALSPVGSSMGNSIRAWLKPSS
jgi:hypothetical protein